MAFDPKNFVPSPPPQAQVIPVPLSPLDKERLRRMESSPLPAAPETWDFAKPEDLERTGYPAGLRSSRGRFQPIKGVPLSGKEQDILTKSQEVIDAAAQTASQLQRAFELNDQAYSGGFPKTRIALGRLFGSDDPAYVASDELENLLGKLALSQLKTTFPGAISDSERKVLLELQGSVSLPRATRARIYQNAIPALQNIIQRNANKIKQVKSGYFATRDTPVAPDSKGTPGRK